MRQTNIIVRLITSRMPGIEIQVRIIKTKGDIMQDISLVKIGGKGVFVKEIEEALLNNEIDMAVHSMKDVPSELPEGLIIAATPPREDPRDVLISRHHRKLENMPQGARIGTGSLRRGIQVGRLLPDIEIVPLRGNLDTRIKKIETDNLEGIIVAAAGMRRMGWQKKVSQFIPVEVMVPSAGQGVLAIELRSGDKDSYEIVSFLNDPKTWLEVHAERAFLKKMGGGCQLPMAAYARKEGLMMTVSGLLASLDGRTFISETIRGPVEEFANLGTKLAEGILQKGGQAVLDEFYS